MYANVAENVGSPNSNALESFDHMDEMFARITYYF